MEERNKTAIILPGGGMRCAHGAGFLYAMATELGIVQPDILIGASGDASNVAYFCAGQWEENRRMTRDLLSTPKFISLWRFWRIMDIDYLVDTIYKHQAPIDVAKVAASSIVWRIPMRDAETGVVRYVGAQDHLDVFEVLRAAKAIPFLYRKRVRIDGHYYIDGAYKTTLEQHIKQVRSLGAERIVVVNHRPHTASFADPTILYINPASPLPCGVATRNQAKVRATFERGVQDARAHKDKLCALFG